MASLSYLITLIFVSAKTCTGLPIINGEMENITAATGDKVGNIIHSISISDFAKLSFRFQT